MVTTVQPAGAQPATSDHGLGLFDLLWMAWLDFLHIIQQLKFGIFLLLVIAVMNIIGAAVPQAAFGDTPADYLQWYTPEQYKWIVILGFDRIFKTGYFIATVALLVVSVTLCAFGRLTAARRLAANTKPHTSLSEIEGARFNGYLELPEHSIESLTASFKARHYTLFTREGSKGETQILLRRGLTAKWANVAMHFAFIVMAVGAIVGILSSLKETTAIIGEGEVHVQPDTGQRIRLAEYYQEYEPKDFPNDMTFFAKVFPTDFKSRLQVLSETGEVLKEETIEVNIPLVYDHVKYYQSSFAQLPEIRFQGNGVDTVIQFQPDQLLPLPFLPKPVMIKPSGSVAGGYWLNPDGSRGDLLPFRVMLWEGRSLNDPENRFSVFPYQELGEGTGILVQDVPQTVPGADGTPVTITLKGVREASILQVKRDRGVPIMYTAFGVCVFGILYPLFFPYHDARLIFQPLEGGGTRVWWGTKYRAGRTALRLFTRRWLGQKAIDPEEDLKGELSL